MQRGAWQTSKKKREPKERWEVERGLSTECHGEDSWFKKQRNFEARCSGRWQFGGSLKMQEPRLKRAWRGDGGEEGRREGCREGTSKTVPGFKAERRGAEAWLRSRDVHGWKRDRESCRRRTWGNKKPLYEKTFTKRRPRPVQRSSNKEDRARLRTPSVSSTRYDPHVRSPRAIALPRPRKKRSRRRKHTGPRLPLPACLHVFARCRDRFSIQQRSCEPRKGRTHAMWHESESSAVSWASFFYYHQIAFFCWVVQLIGCFFFKMTLRYNFLGINESWY